MRKIEIPLDRLLDVVTAIQLDGIDTVHYLLGEVVGILEDVELRRYAELLKQDGYDSKERDDADKHLRQWRARYCGQPQPKPRPEPPVVPSSEDSLDGDNTFETEGFQT